MANCLNSSASNWSFEMFGKKVLEELRLIRSDMKGELKKISVEINELYKVHKEFYNLHKIFCKELEKKLSNDDDNDFVENCPTEKWSLNCDTVTAFNDCRTSNSSESNQSNILVARDNEKSLDLQCTSDIPPQYLKERKISVVPKVEAVDPDIDGISNDDDNGFVENSATDKRSLNCDSVTLFNNSSTCNSSESNQSNILVTRDNEKSLNLQCTGDIPPQYLKESKISTKPKVEADDTNIDGFQSVKMVEDVSNIELKPLSVMLEGRLNRTVSKVQTALRENAFSRRFSKTAVFQSDHQQLSTSGSVSNGAKYKIRCQFCHKTFRHHSSYILHERIHTGEKPFKCSVCDKRFAQKGNLKTHMSLHTKIKPFICHICNKGFAQKLHLQNHVIRHDCFF